MGKKLLFTASTYSHIHHFHLPYLRHFQEQGWVVHVACGGKPQEIDCADKLIRLPLEKSMGSPANFRAAKHLRQLIRKVHEIYGCTMVFVTHDIQDAYSLADRILLLDAGKIQAIGTPKELIQKGYLE